MIRRRPARTAAWAALAATLAMAGCAPRATDTPSATPDLTAVAEAQVPMPELVEHAPRGAVPPPGWEGREWRDVLEAARGQTVSWHLWGGDERLNAWVANYVADVALNRYGIALEVVPLADTAEAVAKLLGERAAGVDEGGSIDLVWLNGENFRTLREADLLYGPWTGFLPSTVNLDLAAPALATDLGTPVDGYELPWGRAQLVLVYDSTRVAAPPRSIGQLLDHARANPGTFTYPAPPDFTGSAFVRLACRELAGRPDIDALLAAPVTDQALAFVGPPCWASLAAAAPALWRGGATYPATVTQLDDLYADGEVWFTLSYSPASADRQVAAGRFGEGTRTAVFEGGTWSNTHFLAIPSTASQPAAAMVLANFLLSPEAQYAKADPANWGDTTVLDLARIPETWRQAFEGLEPGPASLPPSVLAEAALQEPHATWIDPLEAGWLDAVLER